jgi:putative membrane protein
MTDAEAGAGATEPDVRFLLANERTALAWMRTSLAIVGGGVALIALAAHGSAPRWGLVVGGVPCLVGGLLAVAATRRWAQVDRAIRDGTEVRPAVLLVVLAGFVVTLAVVVAVLAAWELWA